MKYRLVYFLPTTIVLTVIVIVGLGVWGRAESIVAARYDTLVEYMQTEFGVDVQYTSFTLHSINTIQLEGGVLKWEGGTVTAPHVTVRINPFRIRPPYGLSLIRSINVERAEVRMDVRALQSSGEQTAGEQTTDPAVNVQISDLFHALDGVRLSVSNSTFILYDGASQYTAEHIQLSAMLSDRMLVYRGGAAVRRYRNVDQPLPLFVRRNSGQVRATFDGIYDVDAAASTAAVRLHDIQVGNFDLHPLSFTVQYKENNLSIANDGQLRDLHVAFAFDISGRSLALNLASDGIRYDQIISAQRGAPLNMPELLRGQYAFVFDLSYDLSTAALEYGLQFDVTHEASALVRLSVHGDQTAMVIEQGTVYSPTGTIQLSGAVDFLRRTMDGALAFDQFTIANSQPISGLFRIVHADDGFTSVTARNLAIGALSIPLIAIDAQFEPSIRAVNLTIIFDQQQQQVVSFVVSSNLRTAATNFTLSALQVNVRQVAQIVSGFVSANDFPIPDAIDDLYINTRIEAQADASEVQVNAPFFNITRRSTSEEVFSFRGGGTQDAATLNPIVLNLFDSRLQGVASMRSIADQIYEFSVVLNSDERSYYLNARYRQNQFIRITGSYGLSGVILFLPQNQLRYTMRLGDLPFRIAQSEFALRLNSNGEFISADTWDIALPTISIVESPPSPDSAEYLTNRDFIPRRLTASVTATPQRIVIDRFSLRDHISSFEGGGTVALNADDVGIDFAIESEQSAERVTVSGYIPFYQPQDLRVDATLEGVDFRHISRSTVRGSVDAAASIRNGVDGIIGDFNFSTQEAFMGNFPLGLAGTIAFADQKVRIDSLDAMYYGYHAQVTEGSTEYDIDGGRIRATINITQDERVSILPDDSVVLTDTPYPLIRSQITATAVLGTSPSSRTPQLQTARMFITPQDDFSTMELALAVNREAAQNRYTVAGDWYAAAGRDSRSRSGDDQPLSGDDQPLSGYIHDDRSFRFDATRQFPISFSVRGLVADQAIDIVLQDIFVDVKNLPRLVDLGFLRFTTGRASGSLRIVGDAADPRLYGRIESDQLSLLVSYLPEEIGPINTFLILQDNQMRITEVFAPVGRNKGAYFKMAMELDGGLVSEFLIDIRTPPGIVVPFRYDFDVVAIDVDAAGSITLLGTPGYLQIEGAIRGEAGRLITRSVSGGARTLVRKTEGNALALNLSLSSGPQFEVIWPSANFPVLRVFPDLGTVVTLRTNSEGILFPEGVISFRRGEIFYFDRNFVVREGSLSLNIIERVFDPLINVRAEIREFTQRGPVSIFLIIEDDFLSQLNPRLEANPPLSSAEIGNILGRNIVGIASNDPPGSAIENARIAIDLAGDVLTRTAGFSTFERSLRDLLQIFDIVTIRTQVLQNIIYDILDSSSTTAVQNISQYFNNTNLFLGTYLSEHLFLQLELGLRVDEQNEYLGGALEDVRFSTAIAFEFQSPLGVLRWNLEPQFQDSFSINSTVGLSWSIGY